MEVTYENVVKWFSTYFEDVREYQGCLETIPKLKKYFTSDFEMWMYTLNDPLELPRSREWLLMTFVHPGLLEELTTQHYVVDLKQMLVVVQFEIRFSDSVSGKEWPPLQASAHYHLVLDEHEDLAIKKIQYWTGTLRPDTYGDLGEMWMKRKDEELTKYAISYMTSSPEKTGL